MYNPFYAIGFSRYERYGCSALTLCFILALSICSIFKPHLYPLSLIGDALKLQLSINAFEDKLIEDDMSNENSNETVGSSTNLQMTNNTAHNTLVYNETNPTSQSLKLDVAQNKENKVEPLCRVLKVDADYCEFDGDIRVNPNSSTIFVVSRRSTIPDSVISSWIIQPYPRRGIRDVKNWTITLAADDDDRIPTCAKNHSFPAILFSMGGFAGNHFHDFSDIIIPLYITSLQFKREVHLLVSEYKRWWSSKFGAFLDRLTRHGLVDIDREKYVHCYDKMIVGLKFDKELIINPPSNPSSEISMNQFRQFLRETYSLERSRAIKWTKGRGTRPRLMIISRKQIRVITNDAEISRAAGNLGYEVVMAEGETSTNLTKFAQLVNSCDVMMGIHGAGLTNMVFLPDNAVVIQVIPLGPFDSVARVDFGYPAPAMNIHYLEYKIEAKESSLVQQYPIDHPVINDPLSQHRNGWVAFATIYLGNQNVTIDTHRFKGLLAKALELLLH